MKIGYDMLQTMLFGKILRKYAVSTDHAGKSAVNCIVNITIMLILINHIINIKYKKYRQINIK